ncbi:NAD(P)/FAD-dependent oxidoreductase [uncultured Paracoccus sp.]|uniref:flavin-containing monooxygenase n=1 Tax=uncultured Paracoccus sp. TaxID=189685 RepID=UPI00262EAE54|nr:NAD(P)/FAD-dependent oxidoreductase [uncultured Paracoccus sp.]
MRVVVIGAGAAGLAAAAALSRHGIAADVLDRNSGIGESWRRRYDGLHLHTPRSHSSLPFRSIPRDWPTYLRRDEVAAYLEDYAASFDIQPRFGVDVREVAPEGVGWRVVTGDGIERADAVIVAAGQNARPNTPHWSGLEDFPGAVLHSSEYRNPGDLDGRVLVIGFGNSGADIALELCEAGRQVELAVRSPVNIVPRDLLGLPTVKLQLLQKILGARVADRITGPVLRLTIGDISRLGLRRAAIGPATQIIETGRVPVLDHGVMARIRDGSIRVRPGVERSVGDEMFFEDGTRAEFDHLVLATGFRSGLADLLPSALHVLAPNGLPRAHGAPGLMPGLYFCGYATRPSGQFRSSGEDAQRIARHIARG